MPPTAVGVERLIINSYPLSNPCNRLLSVTGMRKVAYKVGSVSPPYVHGDLSFPTYLDGLTAVFPGMLIGNVLSDGTTQSDPRVGLETNYEEFYAAVLAPVTSGDGTRAVGWRKATTATWTGVVQVRNFDVRDHDPDHGRMDYSLTLHFRAGRLTPP